ncbi:MAG: exonuclease domain-containing protein [Christensenellaceae bacterium]
MIDKSFATAYTAVDVETSNHYGRSICSIGLVHVEPGAKPVCRHYLVNPEDEFDGMNISIHGIRPSDVEGALTLPQIWEEISPWFSNGILLAHNATFDLSVIQRSLERYELPAPDMYYICTLQKARKHISKDVFGDHKLNTLCNGLNIPLEHHHNAFDDAIACASLFEYLREHFGCDASDVKAFRAPARTDQHDNDAVAEKALNTLHGLLLGIGYDRKILPMEMDVLKVWLHDQRYSANSDIRICCKQLKSALEDEVITKEEYECLLGLSKAAAMCKAQFCITTQATQLLMGILDGVSCDGNINDEEAKRLLGWMEEYQYLRGFYPYDKIFDTLTPMMEDHHLDRSEQSMLLDMIDRILHLVDMNTRIQYDGSAFCLTGNFMHGNKEEIGAMIESRGGSVANGVSKKIQYVVVGGAGSEKWAFGNYGSKVKKALKLIEQGCALQVVGEESLFDD